MSDKDELLYALFLCLMLIGSVYVFSYAVANYNSKKNLNILTHCESIAENMPYESIEECVVELTR